MIRVLAASVRAPGVDTVSALREALDERRFLDGDVPMGERPDVFSAAAWRRMSRLSRLAGSVAVDVLAGWAGDRGALATIWGTSFGELDTTTGLLERLFREGPSRVSPSAFQTSLFGTPMAHLSIALGLTGPSETICAGGCTSALAVMRGMDAIRNGAPAALVLAGDQRAWPLTEQVPRTGEAAAALLLAAGDRGNPIDVVAGEQADAWRVQDAMGRCPAGGLALAAAACLGGGAVAERDGRAAWTIRVGPA